MTFLNAVTRNEEQIDQQNIKKKSKDQETKSDNKEYCF